MLTLVGICEIISRAVLLPWLLKRFNEKSIGIAGLIVFGIGLALIMTSVFLSSIIIISLAVIFIITGEGLFDPTYNARLSQSVDESNQGKLQGVNQSLQSANNMIMPLAAAAIYFYSPCILYATATFIVLVAIIIYAKYIPKTRKN
jgi:DHA1 family tetracycline resistance protein-like MFS transporter